jgi:anti-anti-sigma factor
MEVGLMTKKRLEFASETAAGASHEVIVYTLTGSLIGMPKSYELQDEVRGRIAGGAARIALDLEGVTKIDSAGVGILASLMWSASQAGANLVLAALPVTVEKMLGIAMLLDRIDHADSRSAAIAMLDRA